MTGLLAGKIAFITGGARGLGSAIASCFANEGATGTIFDVAGSPEALPAGFIHAAGDVRDESSLRASFQSMEAVDCVVANAGIVPPWRDTETIDLDEWDQAFAVNVRGVIATIKHAVPHLKAKGGTIIVMGSVNSFIGHPKQAAYSATKHALVGIVRSVADDLGRYNIRINALAPGPVPTSALMNRLYQRESDGSANINETLRAYADTSLRRMVSEADVAGAALFFASDLSSGITGQVLPVDLGLTL